MEYKCIRGVVTSKGVVAIGDVVDLPEAEAAPLMFYGKLVPHDAGVIEAPVVEVENREPKRRGRPARGS